MIYITKDKEKEYRFMYWYEVVEYAQDRIREDRIMKEIVGEQ